MDIMHTIVEKVADREGIDPKDLPSLYDTIDAETLENLIESANDTTINVRFTYCDCDININEEKEVEVRKKDIGLENIRQTD